MINVRVQKRKFQEDYIAVKSNLNSLVIPKGHIFGICVIFAVSTLMTIPAGYLVHDQSIITQNKVITNEYLKTNEHVSAENIIVSEQNIAKENFEDFDIPSTLFKDEILKDSVETKEVLTKKEIEKRQGDYLFLARTVNAVVVNSFVENNKEIIAEEKPKVERLRPTGDWYEQTVNPGDSLSSIFKFLNIPYATLNKITKVDSRGIALNLQIGQKIHFLVKNDIVLEMVKPINDKEQVRFTRLQGTDNFEIVIEDINTHIPNASTVIKAAITMPIAIAGQKERELLEEKRQLAMKLEMERRRKENINPNRPRLIIATIKKGENFNQSARKAGLTPNEIATVEKNFSKSKLQSLKAGDSYRVLFSAIGTNALMNAIEFKSKDAGNMSIFRNTQDGGFYDEKNYTPIAGIFRRFPLAGQIKINSQFNPYRRHPVTGRVTPHKGVDFKAVVGTPVYAPADGEVVFAGYQRAAGYYMIIRHQSNFSTVYMHLSKIEVSKNDKVVVGQLIAKSGNTGRTTGPHLHYEVRINDRPVDPLKIELPKSSNPNLANQQKEAFAANVKKFKVELYKDSLALSTNQNTNEKTK